MSASSSERADRLQRYLEADPGNADLIVDWVDALLDSRRMADARAAVALGLTTEPRNASLRYRQALIDQLAGAHEAALDQLSALVDEGVDPPPVRIARARSLLLLGKPEEALAAFDGIDDTGLDDETRDQVTYLQARALHHLGRVNEAIELTEATLNGRASVSPQLVSALATLYLDADRLEDARKLLQRIGQAGRWDAESMAADGFLALNDGRADAAEHRFRESLSRAGEEGRTHLGLGLSLAAQGHLADAETSLQQATRLMPSHLGSWHALAWVRVSRDDLAGARRVFEAALEKDRTFADSHGAMALLALLEGDRSAAERWIRTGAKLDPASATVAAAKAMYDSGANSLRDPRFVEQALALLPRTSVGTSRALQTLLRAPKR